MFDMREIDIKDIKRLLYNDSLIRHIHIDFLLKCGIKDCNNQTICIIKAAFNYTDGIISSIFPVCHSHFKELFEERCENCKYKNHCKVLQNKSEYIWIRECD